MQAIQIPLKPIDWSESGKRRLLAVKDDPFLFARWERAVFLNFMVEPHMLRLHVPSPFELETFEGQGVVSLVNVSMRDFRPVRLGSAAAWPFTLISEQAFLNLRIYVRLGNEPGVLFLWGWLSRPWRVPLPSGMFGLPYAFGALRYRCDEDAGEITGLATSRTMAGRFAYRARMDAHASLAPCAPRTMSEFAMERYTGFFCRGAERRVFRAWHPPWLQMPVQAEVEDRSLLEGAFPWFRAAQLVGANYAPGFDRVWLGKAHRIPRAPRRRHQALSTFFEMP